MDTHTTICPRREKATAIFKYESLRIAHIKRADSNVYRFRDGEQHLCRHTREDCSDNVLPYRVLRIEQVVVTELLR